MSNLAQLSPGRQILALLAGQGYVDTLSAGSTLETLSTSGASDIYAILSQVRRVIHGATPELAERWYDLTGRGLIELDNDLETLEGLLKHSTEAAVDLALGQIGYHYFLRSIFEGIQDHGCHRATERRPAAQHKVNALYDGIKRIILEQIA